MKKNIKIILASTIAAVGVAASFGGAFALYTNGANKAEFSIGTYKHTSSGTVTYQIGDINNSLGSDKLSPEHNSVLFKAPLGGYYSDDIPNQDFIYGNLRVDLTIPAAIKDTTRWCVYVDGYDEGSYWDSHFDIRRLTEDAGININPVVGTKNSVNKDVAVNAKKDPTVINRTGKAQPEDPTPQELNQWVVVYVDFSEALTEASFKTLAESNFSLDIYFQGVSEDCERPVVIGDGNDWNKDAVEYAMVPNIKNTNWEWGLQNLTGFSKMIIRVRVDGTDDGDYYVKAYYNSEHPEEHQSDRDGDGNLLLDSEKTYHVYIEGVTGSRSTLYKHTESTTNYING